MKRGRPMRRTPLRRTVGLASLRSWTGRARPGEPLNERCQWSYPVRCRRAATDRHHKLRRSQGGTDNAANTLDLCRYHHDWIHANPARSYEWGYLIRSGGQS